MARLTLEEINEKYPDVLREIGNIGAGNAATAVSSMLNERVDISVPVVQLVEVESVGELVGDESDIVVGILLGVEEDLSGSMMFILDLDSAKRLVNHLMFRETDHEVVFDELELSAVKEVGNIISGAYLNAIATMTNLKIVPTVPYVTIDMAAAILSVPAIQFGMMGDHALLIKTELKSELAINGYFILMPEGNSYDKIFEAIGMPL